MHVSLNFLLVPVPCSCAYLVVCRFRYSFLMVIEGSLSRAFESHFPCYSPLKPRLRAFGHLVATCCDMLGFAGSNLKMVKFFMQHLWMLHGVVVV